MLFAGVSCEEGAGTTRTKVVVPPHEASIERSCDMILSHLILQFSRFNRYRRAGASSSQVILIAGLQFLLWMMSRWLFHLHGRGLVTGL